MIEGDLGVILQVLGVLFIIAATMYVVSVMICNFIEWVIKVLRRYKYKHRFNKAPKAKCYCKDCDAYRDRWPDYNSGYCSEFDRGVKEDWFCKDAQPKDW